MATKKAGGSTRNGRDSEAKRLGVKRFGGESVFQQALSSFVNVVLNSTQATTLEWDVTTPYLRQPMVK